MNSNTKEGMDVIPEGASEKRFAEVLRDLMLQKRMSASDLARKVWGTRKDERGYDVARNRDRIGHYLSGASYPEKANLTKIAKALGVTIDVLMQAQPTPAVREFRNPGDVQVVFYTGAKTGGGNLSVNKLDLAVTTITAIMDLIGKDPVHTGMSPQRASSTPKKKSK